MFRFSLLPELLSLQHEAAELLTRVCAHLELPDGSMRRKLPEFPFRGLNFKISESIDNVNMHFGVFQARV